NRDRGRRGSRAARARGFRPSLETLEGRVLLATRVWDGGGADANWTTAANWAGDVAPGAGDDLVFVGGAPRRADTHNTAAGTSFRSITFSGSGYSIGGNALTLTNGITAVNLSGTNTLNTAVTLAADETITSTYGGTTLTLGGALDNGGHLLTVDGTGDTSLTGGVSGARGINQIGPGTPTPSGAHTYGGAAPGTRRG